MPAKSISISRKEMRLPVPGRFPKEGWEACLWHTILLARSSVLYLDEADRIRKWRVPYVRMIRFRILPDKAGERAPCLRECTFDGQRTSKRLCREMYAKGFCREGSIHEHRKDTGNVTIITEPVPARAAE